MNHPTDKDGRKYKKVGSQWHRLSKHGWEVVPDNQEVLVVEGDVIITHKPAPLSDDEQQRIAECEAQQNAREKELLIHFAGLAMQVCGDAVNMAESACERAEAMLDEIKKRGWV